MKARFLLPALGLAASLAVPSSAFASNLVSDGDFATSGAPWFTTQTNGDFPGTQAAAAQDFKFLKERT